MQRAPCAKSPVSDVAALLCRHPSVDNSFDLGNNIGGYISPFVYFQLAMSESLYNLNTGGFILTPFLNAVSYTDKREKEKELQSDANYYLTDRMDRNCTFNLLRRNLNEGK